MLNYLLDEDECSLGTDSCSNSGVCINSVGSYSCDCTGTGYSGSDCTTGNGVLLRIVLLMSQGILKISFSVGYRFTIVNYVLHCECLLCVHFDCFDVIVFNKIV